MRLEPVKRPRGLKLRLAYWMSKRQLGKAITPLTTVNARVPTSLDMSYQMSKFLQSDLSLDRGMRLLIQSNAAQLNRCGFCIDIGESFAARDPELLDKCRSIADFETDPRFTAEERAALRYVREITESGDARDETFDALRRHFTDTEIVEITLINAVENCFNLTNRPLGIESDGLCAIALSRRGNAQPAGVSS